MVVLARSQPDAEEPRVADEPAALGFLDRWRGADLLEPALHRDAPAPRDDHGPRSDRSLLAGANAHDLRHSGDQRRLGDEPDHVTSTAQLHHRLRLNGLAENPLEDRAATHDRGHLAVLRQALVARHVRREVDQRHASRVQALEHVGGTLVEQHAKARQEAVSQTRLRNTGSTPVGPHLLGRGGDRCGVALADDNIAALTAEQERGREPADAGTDDHDLRHKTASRSQRRVRPRRPTAHTIIDDDTCTPAVANPTPGRLRPTRESAGRDRRASCVW